MLSYHRLFLKKENPVSWEMSYWISNAVSFSTEASSSFLIQEAITFQARQVIVSLWKQRGPGNTLVFSCVRKYGCWPLVFSEVIARSHHLKVLSCRPGAWRLMGVQQAGEGLPRLTGSAWQMLDANQHTPSLLCMPGHVLVNLARVCLLPYQPLSRSWVLLLPDPRAGGICWSTHSLTT